MVDRAAEPGWAESQDRWWYQESGATQVVAERCLFMARGLKRRLSDLGSSSALMGVELVVVDDRGCGVEQPRMRRETGKRAGGEGGGSAPYMRSSNLTGAHGPSAPHESKRRHTCTRPFVNHSHSVTTAHPATARPLHVERAI